MPIDIEDLKSFGLVDNNNKLTKDGQLLCVLYGVMLAKYILFHWKDWFKSYGSTK